MSDEFTISEPAVKRDAEPSNTVTIEVNPDLDHATRDDLIRQLSVPDASVGVVGNLADVQRGGASVATGGSMSDGAVAPATA